MSTDTNLYLNPVPAVTVEDTNIDIEYYLLIKLRPAKPS
jgi:hypothetical protein